MKRGAGIAIFVILAAFEARAETVLHGLVVVNQQNGAPLLGVQVTTQGANPNLTRNDGRFQFRYPHRSPGDAAQIAAQKAGYAVVNSYDLNVTLRSQNNPSPLTIIMASNASVALMKAKYYQVAGVKAVENTFARRLAELEAQQSANAATIAQLRRERSQAEAVVPALVRQVTDNETPLARDVYQDALRPYLRGDIQTALEMLDDQALLKAWRGARGRNDAKALDRIVEAFLLKGNLLTLQFRFEEARRTYVLAAQLAPDSYEAQFALGLVDEREQRKAEAAKAYGAALVIATNERVIDASERLFRRASALNGLANVSDDSEVSVGYYQEALAALRRISNGSPGAQENEAAVLFNLRRFEEALAIYDHLAALDPSYNAYRALAIQHLGASYNAARLVPGGDPVKLAKAKLYLDQALGIYRSLPSGDDEIAARLSMLYIERGRLAANQRRPPPEIEAEYLMALNILEGLAQRNPETYEPQLADCLRRLGMSYRDEDKFIDAIAAFGREVSLYRKLDARRGVHDHDDIIETRERWIQSLSDRLAEAQAPRR